MTENRFLLKTTAEPDSVIRSYRDCIESDGIRLGKHFLPFIAPDNILQKENINDL